MMEPKEMALKMAQVLDKKGARDISVLDVSHLSSIADFMVVCSGQNARQVHALAHDLDDKMYEVGVEVHRTEGVGESRWVVMDYDCVLVHIFHPDDREYYNIDRLWMDGTNVVEFEPEYKETEDEEDNWF